MARTTGRHYKAEVLSDKNHEKKPIVFGINGMSLRRKIPAIARYSTCCIFATSFEIHLSTPP
jgi:hypothetical protein